MLSPPPPHLGVDTFSNVYIDGDTSNKTIYYGQKHKGEGGEQYHPKKGGGGGSTTTKQGGKTAQGERGKGAPPKGRGRKQHHAHIGVCAKRGSCVCGMPAGHDKIEHRFCVQTAQVYLAKVALFNDPLWFQILFGSISTLTGQASNCCVSLHAGERHLRTPPTGTFAPACPRTRSASLWGKFAGQCL